MDIRRVSDRERYGDKVFSLNSPSEFERLTMSARLWDPTTIPILEDLQLAPNSRCLEAGAGLGTIASWLARNCPDGTVIATDLSTSLLEQQVDSRARILRHNMITDEFPEESFDLIHARNVLSNIPERDDIIGKMVRWLAPGGVLFIEDPTMAPAESSPNPLLRRMVRVAAATTTKAIGANMTDWPRSFPRPLARHGLTDLRLRMHCATLTAGSVVAEMWRMSVTALIPLLLAEGINAEEIDAWFKLLDDPDLIDIPHATCAALGTRPPHL